MTVRVLTPKDAMTACRNGSLLLDIRPEVITWYKTFDVPDVLYCPWRDLPEYLYRLPRNMDIIIADSHGAHAREAANLLMDGGLSNSIILAGGMVEWEHSGLPVLLNNKSRLTGSCMCQIKFRSKN